MARPVVILQPEDALLLGEQMALEGPPGKTNIGWWNSVSDEARWTVDGALAGDYLVEVEYATDSNSGGASVAIALDGQRISFTTQVTGSWTKYVRQNVGILRLPPAVQNMLAVRAIRKPGCAVMNLRRLVLTPVPPGGERDGENSATGDRQEFFDLAVSISLYGDDPKYLVGAIRNAELLSVVYPGARLHVFFDESVPQDVIEQLEYLGCRLHDCTGLPMSGLFWRFLINDQPGVVRWICRDADSRIGRRETEAVRSWIASGRKFHFMRDHPPHTSFVLAGMFGMYQSDLDMGTRIERWPNVDGYGSDQRFLVEQVYPLFRNDALLHYGAGSRLPGENWQPFPTCRDSNAFVGQVFNHNDRPDPRHRKKVKP